MADKVVTIKISATDAASPQFKKIAAEAKAMGAQVSTSAAQSSKSLEDMQKKGQAVGVAMGAMVGGVSLAGRAFVSQEQQIRGLNRAYGESSIQIQKFSEEIQKNTTYSNDAARQSAQIASTLARGYGLTADQIELLISTTADLAAVNLTAQGTQFSLVDAVQRTSSAIRGEAESAEQLGLTLNDTVVAAEAARRGYVGWTTTMTEAEKAQFRFTYLIEQSAYAHGAAAEAADTNAGKAKQFVNSLQDQVQGLGEASGAAGQYLSVMGDLALALPLVTGLLGKMGAGFSALGLGAGALGPLALIAGGASLAYGYNQDTIGTTGTNEFWNNFLKTGSGIMNTLLPGNPYDVQKYNDQIKQNAQGTILNSGLMAPGEDQSVVWDRIAQLTGTITGEMSTKELIDYVVKTSSAMGMTIDQWVSSKASTNPNFTRDSVSGVWMPKDEFARYTNSRYIAQGGQVGSGAFTMGYGALAGRRFDPYNGMGIYDPYSTMDIGGNRVPREFDPTSAAYRAGGSGAVANDLYLQPWDPTMAGINQPNVGATTSLAGANAAQDAKQAADATAQWQRAIEAMYPGYGNLILGIGGANTALASFKVTQDGLIEQQSVYGGQISEYTTAVDNMTAAHEILNQRTADGIPLTEAQTEFQERYAEALERGNGGIEDATLAQGMLAEQYLLNMKQGDELNASMQGQTEATGDLVGIIRDLIIAMDGIPEEVRTRLELEAADEAMAAVATYSQMLDSIPSSRTTMLYVQTVGDFMGSSSSPLGGAMDGTTMSAYAGGGTVYGGNHALVGERGPEIVWLPNGAQVTNTEASKSRMQAGKRGRNQGANNFYGPVTLNPAGSNAYDAISSAALGGTR